MLDALGQSWSAAAAVCVGLLFLVAAAGKLRHRALVPGVVANYRLLPQWAVMPFAAVLPFIEAVLGLLLFVRQPVAAVGASALLLTFAGAMTINLRRGRSHIDCGCGLGAMRQQLRPALVGRNALLAAALLPILVIPGAPVSPASMMGVVVGALAFLLLLVLDAMLGLPDRRTLTA